jgi:predicted HicB family RNase H-like nuclease
MKQKKNLSRITIDIQEQDHKRFKALAATQGKSMREIIVESIKKSLQQTRSIKFESPEE